jgi:hypothetical protein
MKDAMATLKNGQPAKARADLMRDLLAERLTGLSVRHFVNDAMRWGTETEPDAKRAYESETGAIVGPCGYYDHPTIDMFGGTPDGLLDDGLIEFKCPTSPVYVEWITAGIIPPEHEPQMLAYMACTGRRWCEFVAFDPRVKSDKLRLFIRRFEPPESEIQRIESAAIEFLTELDRAWEALTTAAA